MIVLSGRLRFPSLSTGVAGCLLCVCSCLVVATPAEAQTTRTWIASGIATWSGANWGGGFASGDFGYFSAPSVGASDITVLVGANQTAGGFTFNNGGAVTFRSNGTSTRVLTIGASGLTLNSGAGAVTISVSGSAVNVVLGSSQTWTNNSANPLTIVGTVNTATNAVVGSDLTIAGPGPTTISGAISGSAGRVIQLIKQGAGTLTLSASNSYTGTTTLSGGVLSLANANALAGGGNVTFGGGTLQFGSGVTTDLSARIKSSSGAVAIDTGSNAAITFASAIDSSNVGGLTKTGTGTLTLSAVNTFTGTTTVSAGILALGTNSAISDQSNLLVNGGGFNLAGFNDAVGAVTLTSGSIFGAGTLTSTSAYDVQSGSVSANLGGSVGLTKSTTGTVTLSGANTYAGSTQIAAGTLQLGSNTALPASSALTLGTGSTSGVLEFASNTATLASITFNGSGSQLGTGTGGKLDLLASGTNNAAITVTSGSHVLHPDTSLQSNTVVDVAPGGIFTLHGVIDGTNSLTKLGSGTLTINGANSYSGGSFLSGGFVNAMNTGALGSGTVTIGGNTILNLNNTILSNAVVFASGSGAIINSGTFVNVSGTYSITSGTGSAITTNYSVLPGSNILFVDNLASTVQVQSGAQGSFASDVLSNATVQVNAGGLGAFSGSVTGPVTTSGSSAFSGSVLGNVSVAGGTATFTGPTDAASAVNVSAGLAVFTGTLGGIAHATASGATVEIRSRVLSSADVNAEAGGTVKLMGSQAFDAATIDNAGSVIVDRSANLTLGAVISGSGSLTKSDSLLLTLTGNNTYSGLTTISGGTLAINGQLAGSVAVATGAFLGGAGSIGGVLSGAGIVSPGNSPGILTASQFDPSENLGAAFEFTGSSPVYGVPTDSVNDVLRLTSGTPFTSSLTSLNVIDVFFNVGSIGSGDVFEGGFFTGLSDTALLTMVQGAAFNFWIKNTNGTTSFGGVNYSALTSVPGVTGVTVNTVARTVDFGDGPVAGSVTQFIVVPEPGALALTGLGMAIAGWSLWNRRRSAHVRLERRLAAKWAHGHK